MTQSQLLKVYVLMPHIQGAEMPKAFEDLLQLCGIPFPLCFAPLFIFSLISTIKTPSFYVTLRLFLDLKS